MSSLYGKQDDLFRVKVIVGNGKSLEAIEIAQKQTSNRDFHIMATCGESGCASAIQLTRMGSQTKGGHRKQMRRKTRRSPLKKRK